MFNIGVPVGEPDESYYEDLRCPGHYENGITIWGTVKQFKVNGDTAFIHLKCPECFYPWTVQRERKNHTWNIGFPNVTGEL